MLSKLTKKNKIKHAVYNKLNEYFTMWNYAQFLDLVPLTLCLSISLYRYISLFSQLSSVYQNY